MSLKALQMADSGNPVTQFIGSKNLPLICATALATFQFAMAFRVTHIRLQIGEDVDKLKTEKSYDFFRRTQMNVAEYNGALLALLLFIQYKVDGGQSLGKVGKAGCLLSLSGTIVYIAGYSTQTDENASLGRVVGATLRYLGFAALCYQLFRYTR
eukprot:493403_1